MSVLWFTNRGLVKVPDPIFIRSWHFKLPDLLYVKHFRSARSMKPMWLSGLYGSGPRAEPSLVLSPLKTGIHLRYSLHGLNPNEDQNKDSNASKTQKPTVHCASAINKYVNLLQQWNHIWKSSCNWNLTSIYDNLLSLIFHAWSAFYRGYTVDLDGKW